MADTVIKKGYDIKLVGKPANKLVEAANASSVCVYPREFEPIKLRLLVNEGDDVKRGTPLFFDKRDDRMKYRSPAAGKVRSIVRGPRRFVEQIIIDVAQDEDAEALQSYNPGDIAGLERQALCDYLADTGMLPMILQRPFSRIASPDTLPKSIFVNAMNTAPFQVDSNVALDGEELTFQAGLDALTCLTQGAVHLCMDGSVSSPAAALAKAANVQTHTFTGPHPAGNSSVHIAAVDPIAPGDTVWTIKAPDVALIGRLLLNGMVPHTQVVALGGPGVREDARKHYRIRIGSDLRTVLEGTLEDGEQRVIWGDALSGVTIDADSYARFYGRSITVLNEGRERMMMGWLEPGFKRLSFSRAYLSGWLNGDKQWNLTTNMNGGPRAMVLSGHYDKVMPLNIMVDYLVRAVLADDTDEAVQLGILETDPEDFALCEYICPCKMELQTIIRKGLDLIQEEGL
ncbi:MAG: Na(+)-translocating NADH-quinone reductase subunit A [Verrucomicrobia bacterium]|nr:Na(+)-translocating NADH-quinone reductase subunit A [Verrucomicrobiota bacterium]